MTAQTNGFQENLYFTVTALAWSPDTSKLAVASGQYRESGTYQNVLLNIVDSSTYQVIRTLYSEPSDEWPNFDYLLWDPTGQMLFAGDTVGDIRVYDVNSGVLLRTYAHGGYHVTSLSMNPLGTQTASVSWDGRLEVRDTTTGEVIASIDLSQTDGHLEWVNWNPVGAKLATIADNGNIRIWDAMTISQVQQFSSSVFPFQDTGAWSPDGTKLAVAGNDGFLRIWDVTSGNLLQTLTGEWSHPTWNPISNQLISQEGNRINIWEMTNATLVQQINIPRTIGVSAVALSRDGRLAYGGNHSIVAFDINLSPQLEQTAAPIPFTTLSYDVQPTDTLQNASISPSVQISLRDQSNTPVQRSGIPISVRIDNNPSDGTLSGTLTQFTDSTGVASFNDLSINQAGNGYTLAAAVEGLPAITSNAFTILAPPTNTPTPTNTPAPTATSLPASTCGGGGTSLYRAINLNGPATTIDGIGWESGTGAVPNFSSNGEPYADLSATLTPATDAARADMIRTYQQHWAFNMTMSAVPNGSYQVCAYVWQDWDDPVHPPYSISLNGTVVVPSHDPGPTKGAWWHLGPWPVTVTDGQIRLTTDGEVANISGIEVWHTGTVTLTATPGLTFYRAINLNGPQQLIDEQNWDAGSGSVANFTSNGTPMSDQSAGLVPSTDYARANMIRSYEQHWAFDATMSAVPNGNYQVYLYVWQDWEDPAPESYTYFVNSQAGASFNPGTQKGVWLRLGPWNVNVTNGQIHVTSDGGVANLSGIEVWRSG